MTSIKTGSSSFAVIAIFSSNADGLTGAVILFYSI